MRKQFLQNNPSLNYMKSNILLVALLMTVTLMSCVTSLHPLLTYSTAVTDDRIIGRWKNDDQEYIVQEFFKSDFFEKNKGDLMKEHKDNKGKLTESSKRDSFLFLKSYMINYIKNGIKYELLGNMIRLNGQLFMNFIGVEIQTADTSKNEDFDLPNRLESGTIARVKVINTNTIKLDFIDGSYIYDQVKAGRMKIKNERDDLYDTFLITASTDELQQFIKKYGNDDRFFNKENSVTLIRKS
jgi:hypothetical protein